MAFTSFRSSWWPWTGGGESPRAVSVDPGASRHGRAQAAVVVVSRGLRHLDGCQAGGDDGARGEGVAAHDVDGDQLRPPRRLGDAGFAGDSRRRRSRRCGLRGPRRRCQRGTSTQARSPTWVGRIHTIRDSRPDRVCMRVSKNTRCSRCRENTHQARRMMNRRVHGSANSAGTSPARMTGAHSQDTVRPSAAKRRQARSKMMVSSVRNRHSRSRPAP